MFLFVYLKLWLSPSIEYLMSFELHCSLTRIRKATSEKFPGNEIPLIRSNPEVAAKVNALVDELADDCCIKSIEFGKGVRF